MAQLEIMIILCLNLSGNDFIPYSTEFKVCGLVVFFKLIVEEVDPISHSCSIGLYCFRLKTDKIM